MPWHCDLSALLSTSYTQLLRSCLDPQNWKSYPFLTKYNTLPQSYKIFYPNHPTYLFDMTLRVSIPALISILFLNLDSNSPMCQISLLPVPPMGHHLVLETLRSLAACRAWSRNAVGYSRTNMWTRAALHPVFDWLLVL